jgi:hypothetical protein
MKFAPRIKQLIEKRFTNLKLNEKEVMYLVLLTESNKSKITQMEFNMVNQFSQTPKHPYC